MDKGTGRSGIMLPLYMLKERDHDRKGSKVPATRKLTEIWQDDKK
jgi:hypothetical protein